MAIMPKMISKRVAILNSEDVGNSDRFSYDIRKLELEDSEPTTRIK